MQITYFNKNLGYICDFKLFISTMYPLKYEVS